MHSEKILDQDLLNEELCWQAVLKRDVQADGTFVFAVRSTGIYCRPSCPARRPRREQVAFFQQICEAESAGFRACLRCHPDLVDVPMPQAALVEQICDYIETHLDVPLHLRELSQQFNLSPYHLQRTFKRLKGISPRQYAESCRLQSFKMRLQEGESVTSALYDAGYRSSSSLYARASLQLGMTPTAYQRGGKGMSMDYVVVESSLGFVLLVATERGITIVRFGDSEQALVADLVAEYPEATLTCNEEKLRSWTTLLLQHLQGRISFLAVPLDVQASAFQWKVWRALQNIPAGQTRSYQQVARAIGQPAAARAVARACASNQLAVFIPCHRVVRENGQIGGYRWGVGRKQQLLAIEHTAMASHPGDSKNESYVYNT